MKQEKKESIKVKIVGSFLIIGICCFAHSMIVNLVTLFTLLIIVWGNDLIYLRHRIRNKRAIEGDNLK